MEIRANLGADDTAICQRIKQLRIERDEKQEVVAKALGVTRSTYAKLEGGRNKFNVDMIVRLANHYGVDCDYLLRGHISAHSEICEATGLSGKAVDHLGVYGPLQGVLSSLIEEVEFSAFLAWIGRYIKETSKENPSLEDWYSAEMISYRQKLEEHGFVVLTHSEYARRCYETAIESLKKTLDEITNQKEVAENGQHS